MRRPLFAALSAAAVLITVALAPPAGATPPAGASPSAAATHRNNVRVCSAPQAGSATCMAIRSDVVTNTGGPVPMASSVPAGAKSPQDIRSAYNLPAATGTLGKTVAVVDAYNSPRAESDLGVYRSHYGLSACTTANGCFRKVNQNGGTSLPKNNGGWAQEISLDLDMVSAACPDCKILLVETSSASFANLGAGVNTAVRLGASAVSNSYGGSDASALSAYDHPGIAITASTGDNGYGVQAPASFPSVVAVGGTSLKKDSSARGWSESAWSGAGSGCSTLNANPAWQTTTNCGGKANADVSAVADPNTGVAVYDSYAYQGVSGWLEFGGTSASSPIIAAVYAQGPAVAGYAASYTWGHAAALNDVTTGSNGTCAPSLWCHAGTGWDGPTGLGTPNGVSGF